MTRKNFLMGILVFFSIAASEVYAQAKTLVITGITGHSGDVMAVITSDSNDLAGSMVAVAQGRIDRNSLNFQLVQAGNERQRWSDSGEYYIILIFEGSGNAIYYYSRGGRNALRYNFSSATTTIAYNQFSTGSTTGGNNQSGANNSPKTLAITGITGHSGDVMAVITSDSNDLAGSMVAVAQGRIARNNLTFQLLQAGNERQRWSDSGEYYIILIFEGSGNAIYYYTQGGRNAVRYNITEATTTIAYNQFSTGGTTSSNDRSSANNNSNIYIITGSGTSFSAAIGGRAVPGASGTMQTVIDAIGKTANGADVSIQFGDGTTPLNIGAGVVTFSGQWGHITIAGKVISRSGTTPFTAVMFGDGVSGTSSADISETYTNGYALGKDGAGTLTITGGTIAGQYAAVDVKDSKGNRAIVNVTGGTITGRQSFSISGGTVNISGGTISASILVLNSGNALNVSGGTITVTGSSDHAITTWGRVNITGNVTITSADTRADGGTIRVMGGHSSGEPTLKVARSVTLRNTAGGNVVYIDPKVTNARIEGWPR